MEQTFLTGKPPEPVSSKKFTKAEIAKQRSTRPLSSDARSAEVTRLFEKAVDNKYGRADSFRRIIDLIYYALKKDEPHYMEAVKQLERRTVEFASEIYAHLFKGLYVDSPDGIHDYLGDAYMYLGIGNAAAGQFFTPWPVADMMVQMLFSMEEFEKAKAEGRKITVCDPCVGSGVFLLAWKKAIIQHCGMVEKDGKKVFELETGLRALDQYGFYGVDIDGLMVRMCEIQMMLTDYNYMRDLCIVTAYEMREKAEKGELKPAAPVLKTLNNTTEL